jgi:hypothetical protein
LFLSLSDEKGEAFNGLMEEIWGCVEYLKIPYDTVMEMPVYLRKFWIMKHNGAVAKQNKNNDPNSSTITGDAINTYAKMEQSNEKMRGGAPK